MIKILNKQNCSGCYSCANVCPKQCITMFYDNEGFLYPKVNDVKCINCGLCEKVCPIINNEERISNNEVYACINKNEKIRLESSSGGIFTLLAENIIHNGGVVFGAGFDDDLNLIHSYTMTIEGISKFRGSKYLQSKVGDTYKQAKEFLEKGTKVLYSGTPCQISGLLSYLGRKYDNLICIDIICHGVPSPKVFKLYRSEFENKYKATIRRIAFRLKDYGWKLFSISFLFNNDMEYKSDLTQDIYMKGFLQNLYLRPSCYDCKFKTLNRLSDITIADFWGIGNIVPELDDDKGTSLILINSNKGNMIFKQLQDEMIYKQVDIEQAFKYNSSVFESAKYNPNRNKFFEELDLYSTNISKLINKCTRLSLDKRLYKKIRSTLSKIKRNLLS